MPISDLSLVSQSLKDLLKQHINNTLLSGSSTVDVLLGYPEERNGAQRTINLHLYHVSEDPFNANASSRGEDPNQVATTAMTLSLFYILTAHHSGTKRAEVEQEIMGHALKTLHDFAVVGGHSRVLNDSGDKVPVLISPLGEDEARLEIILRPLTPEDALNYWASEQQQAVRLAAYYEVRLVQLQPEEPKTASGVVLSVGQWVGPMADVRIAKTQSSIVFARPTDIAASLPSLIEISPARPFIAQPPADPLNDPDHRKMLVLGQNLAAGIEQRLIVRNDEWVKKGIPGGEIVIDPSATLPVGVVPWSLDFNDTHVEIGVRPQIVRFVEGGPDITLPVEPGDYKIAIEVVLDRRDDGHEVTERSAWSPFQIAARVANDIAAGSGRIRLQLAAVTEFVASDQAIELVADGHLYERVTAFTGTLAEDEGTFTVANESVTFQPAFDTTAAGLHPVRLSLNGADCQPYWIQTP